MERKKRTFFILFLRFIFPLPSSPSPSLRRSAPSTTAFLPYPFTLQPSPVPPFSSTTHFMVQALKAASTSPNSSFFQSTVVHSLYSRNCFVILSCFPNILFSLYLSVVLYTNPVGICFHILTLEIRRASRK